MVLAIITAFIICWWHCKRRPLPPINQDVTERTPLINGRDMTGGNSSTATVTILPQVPAEVPEKSESGEREKEQLQQETEERSKCVAM